MPTTSMQSASNRLLPNAVLRARTTRNCRDIIGLGGPEVAYVCDRGYPMRIMLEGDDRDVILMRGRAFN